MNGGLVADAGEHVERFAGFGRGVAHAVGGHERQTMLPREIDERLIQSFFSAIEVALEFDEDVLRAEQIEEAGIGSRSQADQAVAKTWRTLREPPRLRLSWRASSCG